MRKRNMQQMKENGENPQDQTKRTETVYLKKNPE